MQTTSVEVDVQASFMLSANPESLIVPTGSTAQTTTITLQPEGTFSGKVNLAVQAPTGITAILQSPYIDPSTGTLTDTMQVSAATGTPPDDDIISIVGTDANGNESSCSVEANVQTASFTLTASPESLSVYAGGPSTATQVLAAGMGGFIGPVTMTVTSITDPNGAAVTNPASWATFQSSGVTSSTGIVITASPFDTLNVQAPPSALAGDYTINITGTDSSGNTTTLSIDLNVIAGFSLVPNPASLYIAPGASGTSTISVDAQGTETGTVTLTTAATDEYGTSVTGITATFAGAATASVAIGGSSTATVNVATGTAPGSYELTVTGTDAGGNTSQATILVTVQTGGFTISPAEDYLTLAAGSAPQTDVVTVAPTSTFSGLVNLSVQSITNGLGTPVTGGVAASFIAPSSVTLPATTMDTLTITAADIPVGEYTINLTGTDSNGNTATAQIEVDVTAGFTITATPQSLTIPPGGSNTSSITVAAAGSEGG